MHIFLFWLSEGYALLLMQMIRKKRSESSQLLSRRKKRSNVEILSDIFQGILVQLNAQLIKTYKEHKRSRYCRFLDAGHFRLIITFSLSDCCSSCCFLPLLCSWGESVNNTSPLKHMDQSQQICFTLLSEDYMYTSQCTISRSSKSYYNRVSFRCVAAQPWDKMLTLQGI